jgi:hypothetical protein
MNPAQRGTVDMSGLDRLVREFESGDVSPSDRVRRFAKLFPPELAKVRRQVGMQPVIVNGSRARGLKAGFFQMRLHDGTTGYLQRRTDDCVTAVIASLLQMPPYLVPDLQLDQQLSAGNDPEEIDRVIEQKFGQWTRKHGLTIMIHASPPVSAKRWIGMISADDEFSNHTLLMAGRDLLFDPAHLLPPGKDQPTALAGYTPSEIDHGITIERT